MVQQTDFCSPLDTQLLPVHKSRFWKDAKYPTDNNTQLLPEYFACFQIFRGQISARLVKTCNKYWIPADPLPKGSAGIWEFLHVFSDRADIWLSPRRARSSPSQRLRFTMLNKLDALHLVVPTIMACALVVSSNRRLNFSLGHTKTCQSSRLLLTTSAHANNLP